MKAVILEVNKKTYKLRLPINAYADYEELCGKSIGSMVYGEAEMFISDLRRLFFLALVYGENPGIDYESGIKIAGDLIEKSSIEHDSIGYLSGLIDKAISQSALPIVARQQGEQEKK